MELIILIISLFIVSIIFSITAKNRINNRTAKNIGDEGEALVAKFLANVPDCVVFNDITLYDSTSKMSCQIDHIAIRPNGVFVIETKNYSGKVFGNDSLQQWTQVLANKKYRFYSPIKQNDRHIYFLAKHLRMHNIYISVVVFLRADLCVQSSTFICCTQESLHQVLTSDTGIIITSKKMQNITTAIAEIENKNAITKEEHINNINVLLHNIESNICPRCKGNLVIRKGKYGDFYGCENYPKCKFAKNRYGR